MRDRSEEDQAKFRFRIDWEEGMEYDLELAKKFLLPDLLKLNEEHKLGSVIADVGCGRFGISSLLPKGQFKIIRVDLVASFEQTKKSLQFPLDLRQIDKLSFGEKRNLVRTKKWLGTEEAKRKQPVIDTLILSSVLNYIDYQTVVKRLATYIKPEGRLVVFNKPEQGRATHGHLFSEKRPKDNYELIIFLASKGFQHEMIRFEGASLTEWQKQEQGRNISILEKLHTGYLSYIGVKK